MNWLRACIIFVALASLLLTFLGCKDMKVDSRKFDKENNNSGQRVLSKAVSGESAHFNIDKDWATLTGLAKRDYGQAVLWVRTNVEVDDQELTLMKLAIAIAQADLAQTDKVLKAIHANDLRSSARSEILRYWSTQDPDRLIEYADKHLSGESKNEGFEESIRVMIGRTDFKGAESAIFRMPYSARRTYSLENFANSWAANAPNDALRWASQLDMAEDRKSAVRAVITSFKNSSNTEALGNVVQNESDPQLLKMAVYNLAQVTTQSRGVAVANEWVTRLPDSLRTAALSGVIQTQALTDPEGAASAALGLKDMDLKQSMIKSILSLKVKEAPGEAAAWVLKLPSSELKMQVIPQLVGSWYVTNSLELSDWVNTLPKGDLRDEALSTLARSLVTSDRGAAMEAAQAISNADKRKNFVNDYHLSPRVNADK